MKHVWVMVFVFDIDEPAARKIATTETDGKRARAIADAVGPRMLANDFQHEGPQCMRCEQDWTQAIATTPCPGDPMQSADTDLVLPAPPTTGLTN